MRAPQHVRITGAGRIHVESLKEEADAIHEEARMVLPGIQMLMGFQLVAVFNSRFDAISATLQLIHLVALVFSTLSIALVMAPAAYHRLAERGVVSARFTVVASGLIAAAMLPLALSIALDVFIVARLILVDWTLATILGAGLAALFGVLWFLWPLGSRRLASRPNAGQR